MPELLLAVDVGTTTACVALFTPGGDLAAQAACRLTTTSPAPGRMVQDAGVIWRKVLHLISEAMSLAGRAPADVGGIGITSQRTSVLVWDRATSRPLTPLVLWNDLRGVDQAARLRQEGFLVAPQQAAAKLRAVLAEAAGRRGGGGHRGLVWGNIDTFLIWKLSGGATHVIDRSQAWPTGFLDPNALEWNRRLIAHQDLDEAAFPSLVDTFGPIATTSRAAFGAKAPIAADIADQQSALIAHGLGAGVAKVTYGTSATFDVATGRSMVFKSHAAPPFIVASVGGEAEFCLEGMVISAGSALDWLRGACRMGRYGRLDALANSVLNSNGAAFLPALNGLGAPTPDPDRTGLLSGLTTAVTTAHLARAGMEGVAFRAREVVEFVSELAGLELPEILNVDGGLTESEVFLQIQADLLGLSIRRHAVREATASGAAICAGRGVGLLTDSDVAAFVRYDRTFPPRLSADEAAARHDVWRRAVDGR